MTPKICAFCNETSDRWWNSSPRVCNKLRCRQQWKLQSNKNKEDGKASVKKYNAKKSKQIKENRKYYKVAILKNMANNNGKCVCEECGAEIKSPSGTNVSHIVSAGANKTFYTDMRNHFILCRPCEQIWTSGNGKEQKSTMKLAERAEEIRIELTKEYYEKNKQK